MNLRVWLLPAGTGIIGLIAGLLINQQALHLPATQQSVATRDTQPVAGSTSGACATSTAASAADVRLAIREELAAFAISVKSASNSLTNRRDIQSDGQAEKKEPIAATSIQLAAATRVHSVVDAAIAHRQWTERDAEQFRNEFDVLTDEQRAEILQKFTVAVNKGQIVPQTDRIPF